MTMVLMMVILMMMMMMMCCRYVMSAEMSAACTTYAQWLDDSSLVSAKDLVKSLSLADNLHIVTYAAGSCRLVAVALTADSCL